jgi:predicted Ser/Thr protein kinase
VEVVTVSDDGEVLVLEGVWDGALWIDQVVQESREDAKKGGKGGKRQPRKEKPKCTKGRVCGMTCIRRVNANGDKTRCRFDPPPLVEQALNTASSMGASSGGGGVPFQMPSLADIRSMAKVGEGAFGAVVISPDGQTAFKYMKDDVGSAPGTRPYKIEAKEIELMQRAGELGVGPRVLGSSKDRTTVAMEFLSGYVPLSKVASMKTLSRNAQKDIARNIIRQAQKLHEAGITHHDMHTGNILYNPTDLSVRVVDYGLANIDTRMPGNALKDFEMMTFYSKLDGVPIIGEKAFQGIASNAFNQTVPSGNIYDQLLKAIDNA